MGSLFPFKLVLLLLRFFFSITSSIRASLSVSLSLRVQIVVRLFSLRYLSSYLSDMPSKELHGRCESDQLGR